MSRDDIRKLIGGYATGSLTESERKVLFDAALDDQELFDELAREQSLKEILDEPGAKQRLIAALGPARTPWWRRPLVWSAAGAVTVAVVAVSWLLERPSPVSQLAKVEPPPVSAVAPAPKNQPTDQTTAQPTEPRPKEAARRALEKTPVVEKKSVTGRLDDAPVPKAKDERDEKRAQSADRVEAAAASVPPQRPSAPPAASQEQAKSTGQVAPFVAQQNQQRQIAGALRAAPRSSRLSFEYLLGDQELTLTFASDGYFSMHFSPGLDTIVESRVTAGTVRHEKIPNNATEASIVFAADPQSISGGISVVREDKSGRVEDPMNVRIEFLLRFYP